MLAQQRTGFSLPAGLASAMRSHPETGRRLWECYWRSIAACISLELPLNVSILSLCTVCLGEETLCIWILVFQAAENHGKRRMGRYHTQ